MKRSRRERRAYNEGKSAGYLEGYSQGLHDGNPFITLVEAVSSIAQSVTELTKNNPEIQKALKEAAEAEQDLNTLEIMEGGDND